MNLMIGVFNLTESRLDPWKYLWGIILIALTEVGLALILNYIKWRKGAKH